MSMRDYFVPPTARENSRAQALPALATSPEQTQTGDSKQGQTLREALIAAREKLFEQARTIETLTGTPTFHAVVIGVVKDDVTVYAQDESRVQELPEPEEGMKMQVVMGAHNGEIGAVIGFSDDTVQLEFEDGRIHSYYYRSNRAKSTLRMQTTGSQDPEDFITGTRVVRIMDGRIGTVTSHADRYGIALAHAGREGTVRVAWNAKNPDDASYEFVGYLKKYNDVRPAEKMRVLIAADGRLFEVPSIVGYALKAGDVVRVSRESMVILGKVSHVIQTGPLASVVTIVDDILCEVSVDDTPRMVFTGGSAAVLEVGARVMLDHSGVVIVKLMPDKKPSFVVRSLPTIRWDDIGGLEEAKAALREVIELPLEHPDIFQHYGTKPAKGALLYGPPGCGKTMLGKATVCSLAEHHGLDAVESAFIYVKGPEILEHLVGKGEANVRELFARARKHKAKHGYPAVLFIDEADAILRKRGTYISSDIGDTIVPMFLAEMDGLDEMGAFVLLATNRPDVLDPAVVRDGRIDRKIKITRPDRKSSRSIFRIHLSDVPLSSGYDNDGLADFGTQELFSDAHGLYTLRRRGKAGDVTVTLGHFVNGGMIAGIVERAKMRALHRDLASNTRTGLSQEDLEAAVWHNLKENSDLNHADVLEEISALYGEVVGVERIPFAVSPRKGVAT